MNILDINLFFGRHLEVKTWAQGHEQDEGFSFASHVSRQERPWAHWVLQLNCIHPLATLREYYSLPFNQGSQVREGVILPRSPSF